MNSFESFNQSLSHCTKSMRDFSSALAAKKKAKAKHLHRFFVLIGFIGFAGVFFLAGAAANFSVLQLVPFGIASMVMMGVGLVGDLVVDGGIYRG